MITVTYEMKPIADMLKRAGVGVNGAVQSELTRIVNNRITKYMPFRSGMLATKSKRITSPTTIEVETPYARYQYYGKVMVGRAPKVVTNRNLNYDHTKHPLAGPYWDRRLVAAERRAISSDLQKFIKQR